MEVWGEHESIDGGYGLGAGVHMGSFCLCRPVSC